MAIKRTSTGEASKYKKILVYGPSGVGKTRVCMTCDKPLIISSENKFESLTGIEIPVWKVTTIDDFEEALEDALGKKGKKYKTICIDSITDIVEVSISAEKPNHKDPRKAYGVIQDRFYDIVKKHIRGSDKKDFYVIAKVHMFANDENMDQYAPRMPGTKMGPEIPYLFDYVFAMKIHGDDEDAYPYFQTNEMQDLKWIAKDSSGKLDPIEEPDLKKLLKKLKK